MNGAMLFAAILEWAGNGIHATVPGPGIFDGADSYFSPRGTPNLLESASTRSGI